MKIGSWVEQCLHALFECQEDVNAITKNHTKTVSGEFCVTSLFLRKLILRVKRRFDSIISVHLSLHLFSFTQWKDKCASYSFTIHLHTVCVRFL